MYTNFWPNRKLTYSFTEEELKIVLCGHYASQMNSKDSVYTYAYLSHEFSVRIVPLLYKNYLGLWKDLFEIAPFPKSYQEHEKEILYSTSLFKAYGNMLWTSLSFDSLGHKLPDYLYQELGLYSFAPLKDLYYANPWDYARYPNCVYGSELHNF